MSAEELKEFFAAMEIVRQANLAWPGVARDVLDYDRFADEDDGLAGPYASVTLH